MQVKRVDSELRRWRDAELGKKWRCTASVVGLTKLFVATADGMKVIGI